MASELVAYLDGVEIGVFEQSLSGALSFRYDDAYRAQRDATPLSLSLPLVRAAHKNRPARAFLQGLLPDSSGRLAELAREYRVSGGNPFVLLSHVGRDAAGAVQLLPPGEASRDAAVRASSSRCSRSHAVRSAAVSEGRGAASSGTRQSTAHCVGCRGESHSDAVSEEAMISANRCRAARTSGSAATKSSPSGSCQYRAVSTASLRAARTASSSGSTSSSASSSVTRSAEVTGGASDDPTGPPMVSGLERAEVARSPSQKTFWRIAGPTVMA